MNLDPKMSADDKLANARREWEACLSHYYEHAEEAHRAGEFYHNTRGEGQWDADALKYLRDNGRPALTFNLVKPVVDTFIGMYDDAKRRPRVVPVGGEDAFLADVLAAIAHRTEQQSGSDDVEAEVLLSGAVCGAGNSVLAVERDPENPRYIRIRDDAISAHEVLWDVTSTRQDRSDAGSFFWSRWLSRSEFKREFPEHADEFDRVVQWAEADGGASAWTGQAPFSSVFGFGDSRGRQDDYTGRYYWDRKRNKIRVVHMEYRCPVKRCFVEGPQGLVEIPPGLKGKFREAGVPYSEVWGEETYWLEFIGTTILYDDKSPEPFDGFAATPYTFHLDSEEGVPYGMVRNLFDPQREVNKSYSQSLDHITAQASPGVTAEEDAIPDIDAFIEERQTPTGVAIVAKDALISGRVRDNPVPEFSVAAQKRLENSGVLLEKIGGISFDDTPAAHAEAAATVQIRYRKSYLKMRGAMRAFEGFQRQRYKKRLQAITRAMPDEQIAAILGNDNRYRVQGGVVFELDSKTGQPKLDPATGRPKMAPLRALRSLKYDVELETTSENTVMRLMELQALVELAGSGVPIPPRLILDKALASRADRDMAEQYAEQMQQAQAQAAEREAAMAQQNVQGTLAIEAQKAQAQTMRVQVDAARAAGENERKRMQEQTDALQAQETARHNLVTELLQAQAQRDGHLSDLLTIWERMDASEKAAMSEVVRAIQQAQAARGVSRAA